MNPIISLIFIALLLFIIPNQATHSSVNSLQRRRHKLPRNIFTESQIRRKLLDDDEEDIDADDNDEDGDDTTEGSDRDDDDDDATEGTEDTEDTDEVSDDNETDDDNESRGSVDDTDFDDSSEGGSDLALFKGVKHFEEEQARRDEQYSQYNDGNYDIIMLLIGNIWCLLFLLIFANGVFFYFYHKERSKNNFIKTRTLIQKNINKNEFSSSEV